MKIITIVMVAIFVFSASACFKNVKTPTSAPTPTAIPPPTPVTPTPTPTPTPVPTLTIEKILEPNFSLNQEGLLNIDLSEMKDWQSPLEKIKILVREFNKKGFLISQIGKFYYDEETETALFYIDFFYAAVPLEEKKMHDITIRSLFVFAARALEPKKIIVVDNDKGVIFIRRSPLDKMDEIKNGNFDPNRWLEKPEFLEPVETEIFYKVMPSALELAGTPSIPGGLLKFDLRGVDRESFVLYFNDLGRFNFKIISIDYDKEKNSLFIHLKLHYSAVRDKKTEEILREFTESQKEELEILTYQIVGSLITSAAKIFNPNMTTIGVYNYDGSISGYFSMVSAMDMLKKASVDWKTYAQKFDLIIAVPKESR